MGDWGTVTKVDSRLAKPGAKRNSTFVTIQSIFPDKKVEAETHSVNVFHARPAVDVSFIVQLQDEEHLPQQLAVAPKENQEGLMMDIDDATCTTDPLIAPDPPTIARETLASPTATTTKMSAAVAAAAAVITKTPTTGEAAAAAAASTPSPYRYHPTTSDPVIPNTEITCNTTEHTYCYTYQTEKYVGRKWYDPGLKVINMDEVPPVKWFFKDHHGEKYTPNDGRPQPSMVDAFLLSYGDKAWSTFMEATNAELKRKRWDELQGWWEGLVFHGTLLLMTRFEFTDMKSFWRKTPQWDLIPDPNFGKFITRDRFLEIYYSQRYSHQPTTRPSNMSSETYRWMLVDDHVKNFNEHYALNYHPTELLVVDESMSRWYGTGGTWINIGLPMYTAIKRKPDNGCEIQDSCDANTGIMIRLHLVKSENERKRIDEYIASLSPTDTEEHILHGAKITLELVRP